MERNCLQENCGKPFQPKREDQKYCSPECRLLAWNQYRCTSISKEARRKKSLRSDFRNPILEAAVDPWPRDIPAGLLLWIDRCCVQLRTAASKNERQSARLKSYHEAEHWRAVAVFAEQLRRKLKRMK
jgi:hypothetical protein